MNQHRILQWTGFLLELMTINANFFRSQIQMTAMGFKIQPWTSAYQLANYSGIRNTLHCASRCSQQQRCQYFDYDSMNKICRIFIDGQIIVANSSSSIVGKIRSYPELYSSYNQTCAANTCQSDRYLFCDTTKNRCKCPMGLAWNLSMCVAMLVPTGWNSTGKTVAGQTGVFNATNNTLNRPESIAIDSSKALYIVDTFNHRVQKWQVNQSSGITVAGQTNGTDGLGLDSLFYPNTIIMDSMGRFYVSEGANNRVTRFDNGSKIGTIVAGDGTVGNSTSRFDKPRGLALDELSNSLFVSDAKNHRILQFTIGTLAGRIAVGGNGRGLNNTQLQYPRGIYFDSTTDSLLIANAEAHNVVRWTLNTNYWTLFAGKIDGSCGSLATELCYPTVVIMDLLGNVYIADEGNQRIQFFARGQSQGATIAGFANTPGSSSIQLNTPTSIAVDDQFNLYVVDHNNSRVQKFSYSQ